MWGIIFCLGAALGAQGSNVKRRRILKSWWVKARRKACGWGGGGRLSEIQGY